MTTAGDLDLIVAGRRRLTPTVAEFVLAHPRGDTLPPFQPGAHLPVTTPSGARRSYSLTGSPDDQRHYVIAVRRDSKGRGGSISMVDELQTGMSLAARTPGNAFPLREADRYLLIAGGIGITPLRAMFHQLLRQGTPVHLVYLNRSRSETAYLDELGAEPLGDSVTLHFDDESGRYDLWPVIAEPSDRTRVYCCGPAPLMDTVEMQTMHWRPSYIHFERFTGLSLSTTAAPFEAVWEPNGQRIQVGSRQSLLEALRNSGLALDSSCESGTCGTCRLRLIAGEALHQDVILSESEHSQAIMPCVSRARHDQITVGPP
jgi:phthalate 4,5-dioxygenase reductase component